MSKLIPKHWKNKASLAKNQLAVYLTTPRLLFNKRPSVCSSTVLLSFPRSGSSWIGSIIGQANDALYLREPVTTLHMTTSKHAISVFAPEKYGQNNPYETLVDRAFKLQVPIGPSIVKYTKQLKNTHSSKHLVIKEINPLAVNSYARADNTVYLVRHPFAVAKSYHALAWQTKDHFIKRFADNEIAVIDGIEKNIRQSDFWQQMGFLQGWIEARTKHTLCNEHCLQVRYEDICQSPETEIDKILSFCHLTSNDVIKDQLSDSLTNEKEVAAGDFSLKRNRKMIGKIAVKKADKENYKKLMKLYQHGFSAYKQYHKSKLDISYNKQSSFLSIED